MSRISIDIPKSIQTKKLIIRESLFEKSIEYSFFFILVMMFPFISIMQLNSDIDKNESIGFSILLLIVSLTVSSLMIYSFFDMNSLKRISGLSRGKNSILIKKIAKDNKWVISSMNQQIIIINFSWKDSGIGTDWGKQITILFDGNDILVNCISFGTHSNPSPFHWFANKRKVNTLISEFENKIKISNNNL